jgi:hypothetical protein
MQTYLVRRPGVAANANELDAAFVRLRALEEQHRGVAARWLRSDVLHEADGRLGLLCRFQADDEAALRHHAALSGLPVGEITPVIGRVVFREEPFGPPAAPAAGSG